MSSDAPQTYLNFIEHFSKLGEAWDLIRAAGEQGPLDERQMRLVKLGIAIGAQRDSLVRSAVRKGLKAGLSPGEIDQCIALAASSLGMPATVAAYSWTRELLDIFENQSPDQEEV